MPGPPPLVVLLVVDQMRADYIDRFGPRFQGGLRLLLDGGMRFTDVQYEHAITFTATGHATLATGVHPSRHGLVSNRYYDGRRRAMVDMVEDPEVEVLGFHSRNGASPRHLLRSGVSDWLLEASPRSRAVSVAIKDRAAIPAGGQHPTVAFWQDKATGKFVTSTWYVDAAPPWLEDFNAALDIVAILGAGWRRLGPASAYPGEDAVEAEADGAHNVFPHDLDGLVALDGSPEHALRFTPLGEEVALRFASVVVENMQLGADEHPDLLVFSASTPDYVGHRYGPDSHELLDTYLRLDRALGRFFQDLDARVGSGQYMVVLTSDHGVMPLPEAVGGKRLGPEAFRPILETALERAARASGVSKLPQAIMSDGVYLQFDPGLGEAAQVAYRGALARALERDPMVAECLSRDRLVSPPQDPGPFWELYRNSFHPDRSPDVFVRFEPFHLYTEHGGTSHGTPYRHDRHVPLLIYGPQIATGTRDEPVTAASVAPTVARLLGIEPPRDLDGIALDLGGGPGGTARVR